MSRRALRFLFLAVFMLAAGPALAAKDCVVLLHGIARTATSMEKLAGAFEKAGYHAVNIDYPSRDYTIENIVKKIRPEVEKECSGRTVHFAGFSMGGLVTRLYIKQHRPEKMGRVVLLGTPNQGSEVADFLADNPLYQGFYGPVGQELKTARDFDKIFGKIDYELGVIAGDRSVDPVSSLIIPEKDDGKVATLRTKTPGMKDHIVLHVSHPFLLIKGEPIRQAVWFIQNGAFDRRPAPPEKRPVYNP